MKRKIVSTLVVVLFFGLALSPSINANVNKQDDLVELDIEFCGLGEKYTVKLTQEGYNEVELIFNVMEERLSDVDSDDAAVEIFNHAIVKLDKYGLLGGLSVKQAQNLITGGYLRQKFLDKLSNLDKSTLDESYANYFCLIGGKFAPIISHNFVITAYYIINGLLLRFLNKLADWATEKEYEKLFSFAKEFEGFIIEKFEFFEIIFFWTLISQFIGFPVVGGRFFPLNFFRTIYGGLTLAGYGELIIIPCDINLISYGLAGLKQWEGKFWGNASILVPEDIPPALIGFTGLSISTYRNSFILGFTLKAEFYPA